MKTYRLKSITLPLFLSLFIVFCACQKDESGIENQTKMLHSGVAVKGANQKIDVCHNNHIINISSNAVPAHQGHGDAVDMDGDGYFDIDNSCSATDCDDNDPAIHPDGEGVCDDGELGTAELLIGVWTTVEFSLEYSVGGLSVVDYLVDVVGLSPADAATQFAILEAALAADLTGSLTLNADNTYVSDFLSASDSGTWSLSADETTLTLFEGPATILITINSISETTLNASLGDGLFFDLDSNPATPEVEVMISANVTMTK